jgi:hypothetical protein
MRFIRTNEFKIALTPDDMKQLSSMERIEKALQDPSILSYDIWDKDACFGFAMLCPFENDGYFSVELCN